jgi:glycosyltransferase involved in cell wall biosynthesis
VTHGVVKYIGYYDSPLNRLENRYHVLAASNKMGYVLGVLNRLGRVTEVVSASTTRSAHGYPGRSIVLHGRNTLRLFRTFPWGGKLRRVVSVLSIRSFLFLWLLLNTERGEDVIVYHSLGYASLVALAQRIRRFRLVLEVEEVYADVSGSRRDREKERRVFDQADAFIFPTELLNNELNEDGRPYAIAHGTYRAEAARGVSFNDGRIHVVYGGTLDPRKGGAASAIAAGLFLDRRYHIHIIGSGSQDEEQATLDLIGAVSSGTACRVTYDGLLSGEEYTVFLQRCDIGLSTQRLDSRFGESSFPSKVLSYLANGLRVVSIRLKVLEESGVKDLLFYYDEDTPEAIASAVSSVDLGEPYDSKERLRELDEQFSRALLAILTS